MTRDPDELRLRLEAWLAPEVGAPVEVADLTRLSGGASRETWLFDATWAGGRHPLVLRRDPPGGGAPGGISRAAEMALLEVAGRHGVAVPAVVCGTSDPAVMGAPGFVMARVAGEAIPRKLLRDDEFAAARPRIIGQAAAALARIHAVEPGDVDVLRPAQSPAELVTGLRTILDVLGEPHPAFEVGIAWLLEHLPAPRPARLVHGDFRTGNLLVSAAGLEAVLDWELAHLGDPVEDLGWMCVRSWRFGVDDKPAGGFGTREELVAAYEAAGGEPVDPETLLFWEVYGTLRWGVISVAQAHTHLSGAVRSVELAAIGRRACEIEHDVLLLLSGPLPAVSSDPEAVPGATGQDRPTLAEALDAVAGFLEDDVPDHLRGRPQFLAKVSARLLRILEREAHLGPAAAADDQAALAKLLGRPADASLAALTREAVAAIRAGDIPLDAAMDSLRGVVARKLAIANPAYAVTA